jgi:hypothetical protein
MYFVVPDNPFIMRKLLLFLVVFLISKHISAQVEIGVKAGLSSYDIAKDGIIIPNDGRLFSLNVENAGFGHHFGLYTRLTVLGVFLEPSLLFNSNTVNYRLKEYGESGVFEKLKSENYNYLDIPVMAGIKLGALRLQGGVVSHIFLYSASDLTDFKGYSQKFRDATYGWQAGAGLDVWRLRLDLNYEGNLTAFGDHITVNGVSYNFENRPGRVVMSLGYRF